jgi:hypothetical protein
MQRSVVIQDMKKGPFSPEEDAILLQRVAEWGDKGQGIWKALEQELGRPSNNIGNRYRKLLKSFHTGQPELPTTPGDPLAADDYLAVDSERKLAAALAPAVADTAAEAEGSLREAAVAAAAVLAGKKRGRPRINPLPLNMDGGYSGDLFQLLSLLHYHLFSQSLNLFTNALGSFLVIPVLLLVNSDSSKTSLLVAGVVVTILTLPYYSLTRTGNEWVPTNLDEGHLDYYFFLLAGLMGLTLVCSLPLLLRSAPAAYI